MEKLFVLALAAACGAASARTPASNPMPDGSRDMYLGLGAISAPRWEGASGRKLSALPVLQVQWSNGLFISGLSAGMHLSDDPSLEYGPLLAIQPRRSQAGDGLQVEGASAPAIRPPTGVRAPAQGLAGVSAIDTRLLAGGFFNYYLAPQWRLTSSVLYGAGNDRNGGLLDLGVQRIAAMLAPHHTLSLLAGISLANRHYNQAYFGISAQDAGNSGRPEYDPAGGIKDIHLGARWNWALSPSWLVITSLQATRLAGAAKDSPLTERPTNLTVSTAVAWRF